MGHTPFNLDTGWRYIIEIKGVVGWRNDCLCQILADLIFINIEGGDEVDITYVIAAEIDVHQSGDEFNILCFLIEMNALHQRRTAVADSY